MRPATLAVSSLLASIGTLACGVRTAATIDRVERVGARASPTAVEGLGKIDFPTTGPTEAQPAFIRGMLLLHSFEYEDAAEAFRDAQSRAPGFALAYWGEALTHCHPVWQEENLEKAREVLARLATTPAERAAKCGDERERDLMASVEILFGDGTRGERARAYAARLAILHERYPDDLEIASLHALAVLGSATQGREIAVYMKAGAIAEQVLAKAPDHPGALHYAIHSFDDPVHAPLGLRMADRYGKVAPAAEHALHMPSHIYVALGMWKESVDANIAASRAADERRARKRLGVDARGFHSLYWLLYSRLQLGDVEAAARLLDEARANEREGSSKRVRSHLANMRATFVVDRQAFDGELAAFEIGIDGLDPATACTELIIRGRAAIARGDLAKAREHLLAMAPLRGPIEELPAGAPTAALCCSTSAGAAKVGYLPDKLAARVTELELAGLIALAEGAREEGLTLLADAAEREDTMGDDFGPPVVVEPAHELYAQTLLRFGRSADAAREFQAALKRAPNRRLSVEGLAKARPAGGS